MIILMKGLNEEKWVKRVIGDFHDEKFVERIIVIDGGSTDFTVQECRQFSKCEVFIHPWNHNYHDMEVCQSNIALSYVPLGSLALIMDFDERMSDELKGVLRTIQTNPETFPEDFDLGHIPRRSYEMMRYPNSPFAVIGPDGWPVLAQQIGQYPDQQCRLIRRRLGMHWVNSPHHVMFGTNWKNVAFGHGTDIIHYHGKEDARDRERIEKLWLKMQARRRMLGLKEDVFECKPRPEIATYADYDTWKDW